MQSISDMLGTYAAYHRHPSNRLTHCFGIPLIVFSLLLALSLLRIPQGNFELTCAGILILVVMPWYLRLDAPLALTVLAFLLPMLFVADALATTLPLSNTLWWSGGLFIGGWALQLWGHAIEKRRPALTDNLLQIFSAPLFLVSELAFALGLRFELRAAIERVAEEIDHELTAQGK